jgi:protein involved in polysaccharide export with SLBB domain/Mrp family chromosome partitioning ATPase
MKILAVTMMGAGMGLIGAVLMAFLCEVSDTRLKTVSDVERVTKLPVLATLGDLREMSPEDQIGWAFRTLTILRGKLCATPDDALVCGIISSGHGEGRSTWVNQLVSAASQRGLRVLTVDTRPTADGPRTEPRPPHRGTAPTADGEAKAEEGTKKGPIITPPPTAAPAAAPVSKEDQEANELLSKPMAVAERLKDPESMVHIPIPGWVWSLDRRKQWQEALAQWREIDNTVILIELPPASCPEAILLAEKIPQLIWLVGSGMADVQETREQLETLRHAHCNIVGAVLNQAPPPALNTRFTRWFSRFSAMILLGIGVCGVVQAQDQKAATDSKPAEAKEQKLAFSGTAQIHRAKWQERLTLGPGDAMDISLYGHPDLTRTNIFVGPDGRISYLQVQGLKVEGMTIEELRAKLDEELTKYFNVARTMVVPTAFNSKKYYVLGKVNSKGVYALDRPMTIVEAVARAQGLETGLYERNTIEMADLSRSFLIRNGQRLDVDFEKLFYEGDLTQNITLEPNDFLFFGAAASKEIYVLGQVLNPGPVGFVPDATVITAITDRGGFTDRAYRGRVLVVRGSLTKPETFVINTKQILDASKPDFKLESRDIVYVGQRPWIRAEELLDEATQSFIQGFVTAFSGVKIGPFIKHPIFGD